MHKYFILTHLLQYINIFNYFAENMVFYIIYLPWDTAGTPQSLMVQNTIIKSRNH